MRTCFLSVFERSQMSYLQPVSSTCPFEAKWYGRVILGRNVVTVLKSAVPPVTLTECLFGTMTPAICV